MKATHARFVLSTRLFSMIGCLSDKDQQCCSTFKTMIKKVTSRNPNRVSPSANGPCAFAFSYILSWDASWFFISCARACTVASEVFTEAQSFADCKLHIRTRLLASASSNFWKTFPDVFRISGYIVISIRIIKHLFVFYHLFAMAFVTISGYPSSGKSRRALELAQFLSAKITSPSYEGSCSTVEVISDDSLGIERSAYDGNTSAVSSPK